jgi:hypothetical protein
MHIAHRFSAAILFAVLTNQAAVTVTTRPAPAGPANHPGLASVSADYGKLPLSFEANTGQADKSVKFLARGSGYGLYLTAEEAVLALHKGGCAELPAAGAGQAASSARQAALRHSEAACAHQTDVVRMRLVGASIGAAAPAGQEQLPGTANYFIGDDPAKWRTSVPTYARVRYRGVYPGVDLVYYGNQRQLEYDFVVAPGTDPKPIRLRFAGARELRLGADGDLVVMVAGGALTFHKPVVYQVVDGQRKTVVGSFALLARHTVGFRLGSYDRRKPLVIDPVLAYSTYLGGSDWDEAHAIAVDVAGNVYVAGFTYSQDFPLTQGAFQTTNHWKSAFVTKLNPAGSALVYSTYLGGSGAVYGDIAYGLAVDGSGNAYIAGQAGSTDFPVTPGAFQTTNHEVGDGLNAFVTKLNPTGSALLYSTYLGGSGGGGPGDVAYGLAVDGSGNAYITGVASYSDFPVTPGAFQTSNHSLYYSNAFVTKLDASGSALVYSTYLGGSDGNGDAANALAVDVSGNAYITGQAYSSDFPVTPGAFQTTNHAASAVGNRLNAFVTKLNPTGSALIYSTYLGGSDGEVCTAGTGDVANGLAVDSSGNAYVAGSTWSADFPVTQGAFQTTNHDAEETWQTCVSKAFVTKLNPTGTALVYSTYLGGTYWGGSVGDGANGVAVDGTGDAYITGFTGSKDFPVTQGAFQTTNSASALGESNAFVTKLNPTGSALVYSTYLGGSGNDNGAGLDWDADIGNALVVDNSDNAYIAGYTGSKDFPVTAGAFQTTSKASLVATNAFVAKLDLSATTTTPTVTIASLSPASATAGGTGFTLTVNGTNFVSGATVNWGSTALATTFISATELTAAVPASLIATAGTVSVTVTTTGGTSNALTFTIEPEGGSPCVYTVSPLAPSTVAATGGNVPITIQTGAACAWSVSGLPGWITVAGNSSGTGPATVTLVVAANTGAARSANVTIAGQTVAVAEAAASGSSILPQLAFGGGWYSALYFTNLTGTAVSFPVSFVSDAGTPLTVPSVGGSATQVNLAAYGTAIIEAPNAGSLVEGYATFALPSGVYGYGVFRQSVAGRPDQEAVVPFSDAGATSNTLTWDETNLTTAVAVSNPSSTATTVAVTLWDENGKIIGTSSIPLGPYSKTEATLRTLPGLSGMVGQRGSAQFTVSTGSVAVLGLRFDGAAFTSIPTTSGSPSNPASSILPQFAFGGGWYSALYFTNITGAPVSFPVSFVSDAGTPLTVPALGGSTTQVNLAANGTAIIEAPNEGSLLEGYAEFSLPSGVYGYGVFRQSVAGRPDQEAVVPFSDAGATSNTLTWDETNLITAVAVSNPSSITTTVAVTLWDENGNIIGTSSIPLGPNSKTEATLRTLPGLSGMVGHRGSAQFTVSTGSVAVLGLRFDGSAFTSIPTANLPPIAINQPQAATPAFSVAAGTYTSAQTVTISDTTLGATIYYAINGTPTTSSTVYSGAIAVSSTETLKAIATASGYSTSAVATAAYTINLPAAATPTFSVPAGTYTTTQTVTISDATTGATIYYAINGTPTASSTVYSGPITVSATEALEAMATASGYSNSAVATAAYTLPGVSGGVFEGTQPVSGAHIYLFAAAATGYGQPSVSLLNEAATGHSDPIGAYVLTGTSGIFSIIGDYTCTPGTPVYLYALGGNAGSGDNDAIGLLAALGNCPGAGNFSTAVPYASVNEISTIAAAYSFAGFATDATHVSSSGTELARTGIANAFATAANLANISTGAALGTTPAGNGTVPEATIGTLANILAECSSSAGPSSAACSTLFSNAKSNGSTGTTPTDTATAAINIAHNPGANVGALFASTAQDSTFAPSLPPLPVPNDFSIGLRFTGGGLFHPYPIAIDGSGNAWIPNQYNFYNGLSSVTELSSTGAFLSGVNGYAGGCLNSPEQVAIDGSGNAWITSVDRNTNGAGCVTELSSSGSLLSGANGFTGGINGPDYIAIDGSGNAWITNVGSAGTFLVELSSSGSNLATYNLPLAYNGVVSGELSIAIDGSGNLWILSYDNIAELSSSGTALSGTNGYTGGGLTQPCAIAIDGSGNVWVLNCDNADNSYNEVIKISNSGSVLSGTNGFTGGGLNEPEGIAIDGSGNAWIANYAGNSVVELSNLGAVLSGANGYMSGTAEPEGIAIDGSGNVWTTSYSNNVVTELIGVATPVVTPLASGVKNRTLGTRP